jgi:hypothetical protein
MSNEQKKGEKLNLDKFFMFLQKNSGIFEEGKINSIWTTLSAKNFMMHKA